MDTDRRTRPDFDGDAWRFRLLGNVGLAVGPRELALTAMNARVLAVLLTAAGAPLSVEALADRLWTDRPADYKTPTYKAVSELRRVFDDAQSGASDHFFGPKNRPTYALRVDDSEQVDLYRFRALRDAAHQHGPQEAVVALRAALAEWGVTGPGTYGGEPMANVSGRWVENYRVTLLEERDAAALKCMEWELELGRHDRLVAELTEFARAHPHDQKVDRLLMVALYRCGRVGDALGVYRERYARLRDEGLPMASESQTLHQKILNSDPDLRWVVDVNEVTGTERAAGDDAGEDSARNDGKPGSDKGGRREDGGSRITIQSMENNGSPVFFDGTFTAPVIGVQNVGLIGSASVSRKNRDD